MQIDYPWRVGAHNRTATTDDEDHIRDLIEQLLFTAPGERVNRPDFGSGLRQFIFDPNRSELATALETVVQGGLQRWLGQLIQVRNVTVQSEDARLTVTVQYSVRRNREDRTATFERKV